ncbi:MAG: hypothetical protein O7H40_18235 [Gammaproteobacteria bacterium]|nr:hypothetical protein [Gammaproteobacteria bacterium]
MFSKGSTAMDGLSGSDGGATGLLRIAGPVARAVDPDRLGDVLNVLFE